MNYLIEGLQGSGKSTLAARMAARHPECAAVREGDYSPIELAWCARVDGAEYARILAQYPDLRAQIAENTVAEGGSRVICYTKVKTGNDAFYRDLERFEIYNGRIPWEAFRALRLERYARWDQDGTISECALLQNSVEDMILFRQMTDEEIVAFYREVRAALEGKPVRILYLRTEDIRESLGVVRRERTDAKGEEVWFRMLCGFFDDAPWAKRRGLSGEDALFGHLAHRQALELRICREVFPDCSTVLPSKGWREEDLP